jgi:hypothetical protein
LQGSIGGRGSLVWVVNVVVLVTVIYLFVSIILSIHPSGVLWRSCVVWLTFLSSPDVQRRPDVITAWLYIDLLLL